MAHTTPQLGHCAVLCVAVVAFLTKRRTDITHSILTWSVGRRPKSKGGLVITYLLAHSVGLRTTLSLSLSERVRRGLEAVCLTCTDRCRAFRSSSEPPRTSLGTCGLLRTRRAARLRGRSGPPCTCPCWPGSPACCIPP